MAAWVVCRALDVVALLTGHHCGDLWHRLRLRPEELERWEHISRRMRVPFHDGVVSQFAGYERLAEFDWDGYRARYGNIGRLDLILEGEGDTPNRYRVSKQADVLMLLYLLSAEELRGLFERLGYNLDGDTITRSVEFYRGRVAHGSTLSRVVHAWVLSRADRERSWSLLAEALDADLADTQGGTTREGVHLGAMAGTADLVLRCYSGLETRGDVLWLHPRIPADVGMLHLEVLYRGQWVVIDVDQRRLRVSLRPCAAAPIQVGVDGAVQTLHAGQSHEFGLSD